MAAEIYEAERLLHEHPHPEWHGTHGITLGELMQSGWDWGQFNYAIPCVEPRKRAWIRARLNYKFQQRFFFRTLGSDPGRTKLFIVRALNEVMELLGPLYAELAEGLNLRDVEVEVTDVDDGSDSSYYDVYRVVNSEYPQNMLNASNDYASDAQDKENVHVSKDTRKGRTTKTKKGGTLTMLDWYDKWQGLDIRALNACEKCFSALPFIDKEV